MNRDDSATVGLLVASGLAASADEVRLELLAGGYRNRVHRWCRPHPAPPAVVKVFVDAPENPLFPTLPDHESAALDLLRGSGIAPEPIAHLRGPANQQVLVYELVPGEPWSTDTAAAGRLLRRVHDVDVRAARLAFRSLPVLPEELAAAAARIAGRIVDAATRQSVESMIRRALGSVVPAAQIVSCLVHTDPGPGNMIVGPAGVRMIDWQCPGMGDPVEDLAAFASPAIQILYGRPPLSADDVSSLLAAHAAGRGGAPSARSAAERYAGLAPLYAARFAAYCAHRMEALRASDPVVSARYHRALVAELSAAEAAAP